MRRWDESFFTLSIGIGALAIFGSYIGKERALTGEAISVTILDTSVAIMAGLIIFPACFAFGINPGEGPGLVFITLPNVFNEMAGGRIWGALFFLFMTFAALSTVIAVFQNIITCTRESLGMVVEKSDIVKRNFAYHFRAPMCAGDDRLGRFSGWWKEYYGYRRFYCK